MTPDLSKLECELDRLRNHGYQLQKSGQTIVKIAESGQANLENYCNAYQTTLNTLGDSPQVQDSLDAFMASGDIAASALHSANQSLEAAENDIYVSIIPALSGVTISNVATQNLVAFAIDTAPEEKKEIFVGLTKKTLQRSFSDEDLDTLLGTFRKDLPKRRRGAWDTFNSPSEDALAQAAHSMRDILNLIIAELGSNERVKACDWFDHSRDPNLCDRVRLLLYGPKDNIPNKDIDFVASQLSDYVSERKNLIKAAHGSQLNRESVRLGMQKIEELVYLILSRPNNDL
jgi:Predicted pPIWI-associating nuclease